MKRPALYLGLPFTAGLVLAAAWQSPLLLCGIAVLALGLIVWRRAWWKYVLLSTLSLVTACCVYWWTDAQTLQKQAGYAGQEAVFTGQIRELAVYDSGWTRCVLAGAFDGGTAARVYLLTDETELDYGDTLTVSGTPAALASGYLFDSAGYARANRICLQFGADAVIQERTPLASPTLRSVIWHWRTEMTARIRSQMREETGAMLTGMLFGDKSGMSNTGKSLMYRMGIGHLLAVSGLHLEFLAFCISWALYHLNVGRRVTFAVVTGFCFLFVICAGETVSVWRAFIMTVIVYFAKAVFRENDSFNSLSIAMLILGIANPYVIHSAAFWLSCCGTLGIGVVGPFMLPEKEEATRPENAFRQAGIMVWTFLTVLPVSAMYFREVSFLSPLSNTLLVPVCMAALLFGAIAVLLGAQGAAAAGFLRLADLLCGVILDISDRIGRIPWTHTSTASRMLLPLLFGAAILGVCVYLADRSRRMTTIAVAVALALTAGCLGMERLRTYRDLRIAVLGSGRNAACVLTAGDESLILDLSGDPATVSHTEAYLTDMGTDSLRALYLCRPGIRSVQQYEEKMGLFIPEEMVLLDDRCKELADYTEVPVRAVSSCEFLFHGARVQLDADGALIGFADNSVYLGSGKKPEGMTALIAVGTCREKLPDCGILIVTDRYSPYLADDYTYIGENDLELTLLENGRCRVRRLYGES